MVQSGHTWWAARYPIGAGAREETHISAAGAEAGRVALLPAVESRADSHYESMSTLQGWPGWSTAGPWVWQLVVRSCAVRQVCLIFIYSYKV